MMQGVQIRRLECVGPSEIMALCAVLADCVEGGASVGFMLPLDRARMERFWKMVAAEVGSGERAIVVAEDEGGVCGTAQVVLGMPQNQPHRGDVCKVLVHRRARRRGVGVALMRKVEEVARQEGKTLLVLDTVTGSDAYAMYEKMGWVRCGDIPGYALMPDGAVCGTTYFWKCV